METGGTNGSPVAPDFERARAVRERLVRGEQLSLDERAELAAARARWRGEQRLDRLTPARDDLLPTPPDLYRSQQGILVGEGPVRIGWYRNPVVRLAVLAEGEEAIRPLDAEGRPAADGTIGMVWIDRTVGSAHFGDLTRVASRRRDIADNVTFVDGSVDVRRDDRIWSGSGLEPVEPLETIVGGLAKENLTTQQVQVVWIHEPAVRVRRIGSQEKRFAQEVSALRRYFPNIRRAYLSMEVDRVPVGWHGLKPFMRPNDDPVWGEVSARGRANIAVSRLLGFLSTHDGSRDWITRRPNRRLRD